MNNRGRSKNDNQLELFSAIFADIVTRDSQETMEVPFLSLAKRPRFTPIEYSANGVEVTVTANERYGIANIWDWDLVMWLLSQVRQAIDHGLPVSRRIRFSRRAYLRDSRRRSSGREYERLEQTIKRLRTTTIETTMRAPKGSRTIIFNWFEYADLERDEEGHVRDAVVTIPEWLFDAVCDKSRLLQLHRDYFRLSGGIERFLYRFVRKGPGEGTWRWKMTTLHERSGVTSDYKYFARDVRKIVAENPILLDYHLRHFVEGGTAKVEARKTVKKKPPHAVLISDEPTARFLHLKAETYEKAKWAAPGYDVYAIEKQWRDSSLKNGLNLRDPDKAFVAYCTAVAERQPLR